MRGCRKVSNAKETQPHASETHGGHGPVAVALCLGAHSACVLALSRATAGRLGPGGACHSESIQSRQPVPLASVALLLRRARFDDAAGRLGLRRIVGPASRAPPSSSEAKNRQKRENEVAWLWRKKMTPALALAPKFCNGFQPQFNSPVAANSTRATSDGPRGAVCGLRDLLRREGPRAAVGWCCHMQAQRLRARICQAPCCRAGF